MRYLVLILMITGLAFSGGCSGGSSGSGMTKQEQVLEVLTNTVIIPDLNTFSERSASLNAAVATFVSNPSESTLTTAQDNWKITQESWQKTEAFQFGPVKDQRLLNKINFWPKRPDSIDEVIDGGDELTLSYLTDLGAAKKGLPVLEYLLFDHVNGNSSVITTFQSSDRRSLYTNLVVQELAQNATTLQQSWRTDGIDYGSSFISSSDGLNMIVNQMVFLLENTKNSKLGKPMGKSSGGSVRPEEVESQQSEQSLTHIKYNIQGLNTLFNGGNGNGIDDYIDFRGHTSIRESINSQIQTVLTRIGSIDTPLWEAVTTDSSTLETLYTELTELLRLVKVDMATAINETIHFNDSDGD
jgi:predicted lipoprotein